MKVTILLMALISAAMSAPVAQSSYGSYGDYGMVPELGRIHKADESVQATIKMFRLRRSITLPHRLEDTAAMRMFLLPLEGMAHIRITSETKQRRMLLNHLRQRAYDP
jgi:hypothetical protein